MIDTDFMNGSGSSEDEQSQRKKRNDSALESHAKKRAKSLASNQAKRLAEKGAKKIAQMMIQQGIIAGGRAVVSAIISSGPWGWIVAVVIILLILLSIIFFRPDGGGSSSEEEIPPPSAGAPQFPPIPGLTLTLTGPDSRDNGQTISYSISYNYDSTAAGAPPLESITIYDALPTNTSFVSASGEYANSGGTISWQLNNPTNQTTLTLTLRPNSNDTFITNKVYARTTAAVSAGGYSSNSCTQQFEGTGYCSVQSLLPYFNGDETKAIIASMICQRESSSNPFSINRNCGTNDYSVGLYQINLVAHCPGAYANLNCNNLVSESARATCEGQLLDPLQNIQKMLSLSSTGVNFSPWSALPFVENDLSSCNINI